MLAGITRIAFSPPWRGAPRSTREERKPRSCNPRASIPHPACVDCRTGRTRALPVDKKR